MRVLSKLLWLGVLLHIAAATTASTTTTDSLNDNIKVVFAGFGRTGTHSLGEALERLGYRALHGEETALNCLTTHHDVAQAIIDQNASELLRVTSEMGYNATLEHHGMFWRDIRKLLPKSTKYIFILRDFESWWESIVATLDPLTLMERFPLNMVPLHQRIVQLLAAGMAHELQVSPQTVRTFIRNPRSVQHYQARRQAYDRYVKDAKDIVAHDPDRNLLIRSSDFSYDKLCSFLNVESKDCPSDEAYPHASPRAIMTQNYYLLCFLEIMFYVVNALIMIAMYKILMVLLSFSKRATPSNSDKTTTTEGKKTQ